ncbi:YbaB/EbfC family nucleoid-associated protein [Nocardia seriolae]|nr:YbaB/EbfC family nucleoid-associated protein [Nocardia seriolae]QUN15536.1 YbaB/EbfC family nucleoid-associated protein [Nocardia seriolae]
MSGEAVDAVQAMLAQKVAVAASPDGSVTVRVGADGKVHRWAVTDRARSADPQQVVATLIALIEQARSAAYEAVRAELGHRGANEHHSGSRGLTTADPRSGPAFTDAVEYDDWQREQSLNVLRRRQTTVRPRQGSLHRSVRTHHRTRRHRLDGRFDRLGQAMGHRLRQARLQRRRHRQSACTLHQPPVLPDRPRGLQPCARQLQRGHEPEQGHSTGKAIGPQLRRHRCQLGASARSGRHRRRTENQHPRSSRKHRHPRPRRQYRQTEDRRRCMAQICWL